MLNYYLEQLELCELETGFKFASQLEPTLQLVSSRLVPRPSTTTIESRGGFFGFRFSKNAIK